MPVLTDAYGSRRTGSDSPLSIQNSSREGEEAIAAIVEKLMPLHEYGVPCGLMRFIMRFFYTMKDY